MSVLAIAPRSRLSRTDRDHWDFSAVASLVRNLIECYFTFFYLVIDPRDNEEWQCRLTIMELHDCITRLKMFRDFDSDDEQLQKFEQQLEELTKRLIVIPLFSSLPEKQQKKYLKGESAFLLNQDELLCRMDEPVGFFRGMYRFLSTHVHTLPMAFSRIGEQGRGLGLENDVEKRHISNSLQFAEHFVRRATKEMIGLFPEIKDITLISDNPICK
jgi:hypothetical protein